MNRISKSTLHVALSLGASLGIGVLPAVAASSAASSASESVATSVGSVSGSFQKSSDSSSKTTNVAAGDYRIVEVVAVAERPGTARLKLQALATPAEGSAADAEFYLYLPQVTVAGSGLAADQVVSARQRPYGVEFAAGPAREAFFLVLADDWYRELKSERVTL
jgi:hypothetical protein